MRRNTRVRRQWLLVLVGLLVCALVSGCGGCNVQRGKNSDLDRPKPADKPG